jgi:hypothetical protein
MLSRVSLLAALCLALGAVSVAAQPSPTYTLDGIVRDFTGAVVVGADVTLTQDGNTSHTSTDANGRFRFDGLFPRDYRVGAAAPGFAEATRAIEIRRDQRTSIELVLQVLITEHVDVVTAAPAAGLSATTLSGAALAALPDDPAALLQRVRELAGATDSLSQITVTVDGFHQSLWLPPKDAIQAIRISSNWFAPEFAEPGQARIEIITKPGLSGVHGDVRTNMNDEVINARNALAPRSASGRMRDVSGYLSGPIVTGRWSFVLYGGVWSRTQNHVINATVLDADDLAPAPRIDVVSSPSRIGNLWLGTTYQLAPLHTLAISVARTTDRAGALGLESGLDLPERSFRRTAADTSLRATLTSVPSTRALNEFRVQLNPRHSTSQADSSAPAIIVFDAFNGGGNQDALLTAARHVDVDVIDSVTTSVAKHTMKLGVDAHTTLRRHTDATRFGGVFMFGSDVERDPSGNPTDAASGDRRLIAPLENYRRTLLQLPGYGPSQFSMTAGDPNVRFRDTSVGAFVQDDWIQSPRLTLTYGVRFESQSAASRPGVGPRAGIAVALDPARKNVIRAGAGSFFQRIAPELTLDVTRLDGHHQQQVLIDHPSFFPFIPADLTTTTAASQTIYRAAADLRAPRILIAAASYERELPARMFVTMKYSYQRGSDLLRTRTLNPAELAEDARFARVLQYESTGALHRQELTSGWRLNAGPRGSFFANYSYVHGRSDTDGRSTTPSDGMRLDREFGPTAADRDHYATLGANLTVPGNVFVSPYLTAASGRPFNITTGFDNNGDGVFADRPGIAAAGMAGAIQTPQGWFLAGRPDDAPIVGRNSAREPAMLRLDLRVSRAFRHAGAASPVVAANVENLLNRANFEGMNGVVTSPSFGLPKRAGTARRITLSAGVSF